MEGSHWISMKNMLMELSKRGHQIVVIAPDNKILIDSSDVYELKTYSVPLMTEDMEELIHSFSITGSLFHASCKSLLHNQELLKYIGEGHFDALLTDPVSPCGQIIALHFSIPSVFFLRLVPCALEVRAAQGPDPPSYVPRMFSENSDHMAFSQRVKNFLIALSESFICNIAYTPFEELASEFLQKPMTMTEILSHGSIWLRRIDFVFEYPMPVMPNMVFIGGIHCGEKKKPLSQVRGWQPGRGRDTHLHGPTCGGKLLVMPMDESYWLSLRLLVVALSQKGHQIVTVPPEANLGMEASTCYSFKRNDPFERKPFRQRITAVLKKFRFTSNI
ncbi:UDP-glucuronosyltransferase 1-5-like [Geospiza fortis]|uniref:glucuronosyltransferase n=1 Tax=Geospiza fortis TaxID=48883 RepID=A0A8N5EZS8_GEOFO|nr:UDP-glucuronosyltransferase 1-5-like [Geospiza fortis]